MIIIFQLNLVYFKIFYLRRSNEMLELTPSLSDTSRTNQLKITEKPEIVAKKLFQYLFKMGKGIETFPADNLDISGMRKLRLIISKNAIGRLSRKSKKGLLCIVKTGKPQIYSISFHIPMVKTLCFFCHPIRHIWLDRIVHEAQN